MDGITSLSDTLADTISDGTDTIAVETPSKAPARARKPRASKPTAAKKRPVKSVETDDIIDDLDQPADEEVIDFESGETDSDPKKGPGRPRKSNPRKQLLREGIVSTPSNVEDSEHAYAVEFLYENPNMLKKVFFLFKVYSAEYITLLFEKDRVFLYGVNSNSEVKILVEIFCDKMNKYYNAKPIRMSLGTEYFYNIFQSVTKDHAKIALLTTNSFASQKLWIVFETEDNEQSIYEIRLNQLKESNLSDIRDILVNEKQYPIKFDIPSKNLKRKVSEYVYLKSKKISIEQTIDDDGKREICFSTNTSDNRVSNRSPLANMQQMNFISEYDQKLFIAPILLSNIRPLANSLISEKIRLSVDEKQDLILSASLDFDLDAKTKSKIPNSEKCIIRVAISLAKSDRTDEH